MSLGFLRKSARIAIVAGATGSLVLMFHAGRPGIALELIMSAWVLGPFVVVAVADAVFRRSANSIRITLYVVVIAISCGSLAIYGADAVWPFRPQRAFALVMVPPLSCLLMVIAAVTARLRKGRS